jgi:nucleotide-binding universal stress UspA family protein
MTEDTRPVVAAFDGTPAAEAAIRAAAALFRGRCIIVVSVWEPGLAMATLSTPDATGFTYIPPDPETVQITDRVEHEHADSMAEAGAAIVRGLGGEAQPMSIPDSVNVAETVIGIAQERDAAAIVVGTRGLGKVKSAFVGSTSRRLLHDAHRPVLVVSE